MGTQPVSFQRRKLVSHQLAIVTIADSVGLGQTDCVDVQKMSPSAPNAAS